MCTSKVLELGKGITRLMNEKVQACKEIMSSAQNRLIIGLIAFGLGIGLIASAYLHVPM